MCFLDLYKVFADGYGVVFAPVRRNREVSRQRGDIPVFELDKSCDMRYIYSNTLETHHFIFTDFSHMVEFRIFSWSYFIFMYNDK